MISYPKKASRVVCFCIYFSVLLLMACGTRTSVLMPDRGLQKEFDVLQKSFQKIVLYNFEADENVLQSYPDAATICETAALNELLKISSASMITKASSPTTRQPDTLLVKVRLIYSRPPLKKQTRSASSRTVLTAHVRLIDAADGKTLKEENISVPADAKPALAGLPADLGLLIARYVDKFIPKNP